MPTIAHARISLLARLRAARLGTGMAVSLAALGCGGGDHGDELSDPLPPVPFPGCESEQYEPCDVLEPSCQEAMFELVRCVRPLPGGTLVPIRTLTTDEYAAELAAESQDGTSAETEVLELALELLMLAAPGQLSAASSAELLVDTVPGFYSNDTDTITLVVPDRPLAEGERARRRFLLAHEMVHALQDQEHDLQKLRAEAPTFDASLAVVSAIEGEAELYQAFIEAASWGFAQEEVDFLARFARIADLGEEQLVVESPALWVWRVFPYAYGARYAWHTWREGGASAVAALLDAPPGGSQPYLASETELVNDALSPVTEAPPAPPAGYAVYSEDVLGAFLLGEYAEQLGADAPYLARSWRGDRFTIFRDDSVARVAVAWRVRLATEADAATFAAAVTAEAQVTSPSGRLGAVHSGTDVLVLATQVQGQAAAWLDGLDGLDG